VQLCLTGFLATYLVTEIGLSLVVAGTLLSITHAAGAFGRLGWGLLADRLRSGGYALAINGAATIAAGLFTAAVAPSWPFWAIALAWRDFRSERHGLERRLHRGRWRARHRPVASALPRAAAFRSPMPG
jgi:hypothetical protein